MPGTGRRRRQAARGKLIEHNLRLVAHIVKKYYTQIGGDTDDLISIGTLGLIKAVNTYNMEKKIKLGHLRRPVH